jgi:hypothetical protein
LGGEQRGRAELLDHLPQEGYMKAVIIALILFTSSSVSWGGDEPNQAVSDDAKECVKNFTEEGSFFKGKTYKTWREYKDAEYDKVFRMVAQAVAEDNWGNVNANKELGIITGGQAVTMGQGSVAPLNVIVKERVGALSALKPILAPQVGRRHSPSPFVPDSANSLRLLRNSWS